jgi:hypothetical protein
MLCPILIAAPLPIDLDGVTVERARVLAGRVVLAEFLSVKPVWVLKGRMIIGAVSRDDGPSGPRWCGA